MGLKRDKVELGPFFKGLFLLESPGLHEVGFVFWGFCR